MKNITDFVINYAMICFSRKCDYCRWAENILWENKKDYVQRRTDQNCENCYLSVLLRRSHRYLIFSCFNISNARIISLFISLFNLFYRNYKSWSFPIWWFFWRIKHNAIFQIRYVGRYNRWICFHTRHKRRYPNIYSIEESEAWSAVFPLYFQEQYLFKRSATSSKKMAWKSHFINHWA